MTARRRTPGSARRGFWLILALLLLAGCSTGGARLQTLWDAPQFDLTDETGQPFSSGQLTGRAWLIDFIYTNCPDACPTYLSPKMMALQREVLARNLAGKAELVSLTVDPARDTPPVLAEYAARYGADPRVWHFLTGPAATIQPLLQAGFKVGSAVPSENVPVSGGSEATPTGGAGRAAGGHDVLVHTSYFLLVDRQGRIRAIYDGEQVQAEEMLRGLEAALRE